MKWNNTNQTCKNTKLIKISDKKQLSGGGSMMGILSLMVAASQVVATSLGVATYFQSSETTPAPMPYKNNWTDHDITTKQHMIRYSSKNTNTITYI